MVVWDKDDYGQSEAESGVIHDTISDHDGSLEQGYDYGSLTEGLVAYYPMEFGDESTLYDGALDKHGTINGASWTQGHIGDNALSFDGTDDDVDLGTPFNGPMGAYTVSAVVDSNVADGNYHRILEMRNNNGVFIGVNSNDKWEIQHYDGNGSFQSTVGSSISTNTTKLISATYDGSKVILYEDGVEVSRTSVNGHSENNKSPVFIGANEVGGQRWNGVIDDVRIYNRALSTPEVKALYNLSKPSGSIQSSNVTKGLVSHYKLDGDATDSEGSNDGTVNGATFVDGYKGQAASFDNTDDYINTGLNINVGTGDFALSSWVYLNADNAAQESITTSYGSSTDGVILNADTTSTSGWRFWINGTDARLGTPENHLQEWTHIIALRDSGTAKVYINGKLIGSFDASGVNADATGTFHIGSRSDGTKIWDGEIDDVRIYNRALTPLEVEQLYYDGKQRIERMDVI